MDGWKWLWIAGDFNGLLQMAIDGYRWLWMAMDGYGWLWMAMDNLKNAQGWLIYMEALFLRKNFGWLWMAEDG